MFQDESYQATRLGSACGCRWNEFMPCRLRSMGPQIQHNDKELWQHKRQAYEGDSLPYCNMKTSPTKTSGSWWIRVEIDIRNQGRCMEKAHKNLQQASTLPECLGSAKLHPCNVSKFLSSRRDGRSTDRNAWRPGRSESSETKPTIEHPTFSRVAEGLPASSHIFWLKIANKAHRQGYEHQLWVQ